MGRNKKEKVDPRFRSFSDFYQLQPSSVQFCPLFENGQSEEVNLNLLEMRRLYKRALKKVPAHTKFFVDGRWVHEHDIGKIRTNGIDRKNVEEAQIRARPFDALDTAVVELGDRAYNLLKLYEDCSRNVNTYISIIGTLQERGLVSRVIGDNLTNNV